MKTFLKKIAFTFCIFSMFALQSRAQWDAEKMHLQIDWQMNAPYSTDFADKISGYFGVKLGAAYTRYTTYYGTGGVYDNPWGFYASPEIGLKIFPFKSRRLGFHVAGYYSYMTNQAQTLTGEGIDGQNNAGFRLGVIF